MQSLGSMSVKYRADSERRAVHSLRMSGRSFWDCGERTGLTHVKEAMPAHARRHVANVSGIKTEGKIHGWLCELKLEYDVHRIKSL